MAARARLGRSLSGGRPKGAWSKGQACVRSLDRQPLQKLCVQARLTASTPPPGEGPKVVPQTAQLRMSLHSRLPPPVIAALDAPARASCDGGPFVLHHVAASSLFGFLLPIRQ